MLDAAHNTFETLQNLLVAILFEHRKSNSHERGRERGCTNGRNQISSANKEH